MVSTPARREQVRYMLDKGLSERRSRTGIADTALE